MFNTPTGAAYTTVSVQRLFTGDTAWTTVMTGYCTGTEKVATVTTTLAGYTESSGIVTTHEDVNMTLTLHPDAFGSPANTISMDAQVRAS